jgi:hypothetical protein
MTVNLLTISPKERKETGVTLMPSLTNTNYVLLLTIIMKEFFVVSVFLLIIGRKEVK